MDKQKFQCEKCGSAFIYFRIKTNKIVCRKCGHITESKEVKEK